MILFPIRLMAWAIRWAIGLAIAGNIVTATLDLRAETGRILQRGGLISLVAITNALMYPERVPKRPTKRTDGHVKRR